MKGENKLLEGLKGLGSNEEPQKLVILFLELWDMYFYTHYKDIGHTPLEAKTLALEAIDTNFGAYAWRETAPIFPTSWWYYR